MRIFQVDSFTEEPFKGNPAGVCICEEEINEELMLKIAAEMNLSETAFLRIKDDFVDIRFFTPEKEVSLCGHASLASAYILYKRGYFDKNSKITFSSKAGNLIISNESGYIKMNFPSYSLKKVSTDDAKNLFGITPLEVYHSDYNWKILVLKSEVDVKNFNPDFEKMKREGFGHLMITAPSNDPDIDFVQRCFAPEMGINEDPVTGSALCALTPLWYKKTSKKNLFSVQLSKRKGYLKSIYSGDRVIIMGKAVEVFQIELKI